MQWEINLPASHVDRVMQAVEKEYAKDAKEIQHIDGLGMDFGSGGLICALQYGAPD